MQKYKILASTFGPVSSANISVHMKLNKANLQVAFLQDGAKNETH